MKLGKREQVVLADIADYPKHPKFGYSAWWTPKTNKKLAEKGLVEIVGDRVYIADAGMEEITKP